LQIQISAGEVPTNDSAIAMIESEIHSALELFSERVTRVEVYLRDQNGPKQGVDTRCLVEVRLAGLQPFAVEHDGEGLADAVRNAAQKLERAVRRKVERLKDWKQTS